MKFLFGFILFYISIISPSHGQDEWEDHLGVGVGPSL